ncbi:MAG: ABC transporter ATP-binding protein [Caldiserica bacterium]|nr:ABC transporter ATP-binding protein [Caldisericota bacterium]
MKNSKLPKIIVRNLGKSFLTPRGERVEVIKEISFEVQEGEFLVILGPSGCGKTTLLNLLVGFEKPDRGEVLIDGERAKEVSPERILLWQFFGLFPWRTIWENIEFGLELKRVPQAEREKIISELVRITGLRGFENRYPGEISGGMQQRVSLARALAVDPEVLFMDEPFGSLDASMRKVLEDELLRILSRKKKTVVFVTHNVEEALYLADRIIILSSRPTRIVKEIVPSFSKPRDEISDEFLKLKNEIVKILRTETQFLYTVGL